MSLDQEEKIKEEIRFNTEVLKLFVVVLVGTLGGVVSLIVIGTMNGRVLIFIFFGLLLSVVLIIGIYSFYKGIKNLIDGD